MRPAYRNWASGTLICLAPALPESAMAGKVALPQVAPAEKVDGVFAVNLARATLMSVHDANVAGNYTVLKTSEAQHSNAGRRANWQRLLTHCGSAILIYSQPPRPFPASARLR